MHRSMRFSKIGYSYEISWTSFPTQERNFSLLLPGKPNCLSLTQIKVDSEILAVNQSARGPPGLSQASEKEPPSCNVACSLFQSDLHLLCLTLWSARKPLCFSALVIFLSTAFTRVMNTHKAMHVANSRADKMPRPNNSRRLEQ